MGTCARLFQRLAPWRGCQFCHISIRQYRHHQICSQGVLYSRTIQFSNKFHTSTYHSQEDRQNPIQEERGVSAESKRTLALSRNLFKEAAEKAADKETFYQLIRTFGEVDKRRKGHLQFIETALRYMKHFRVEKDIEAYNKLLDVFPKGVFVAKNIWQVIFNHFPEQQTVALKVLQKLEDNKLMPNSDTKRILLEVFGRQSHPVKKYQRIMYWFPKFRNINPFPLPHELPADPIQLSELGLKRICEYEAELKILSDSDVNSKEFIASAQSPEQRDLLSQHPPYRSLYVEGPFNLWLRDIKLGYYILRSDPIYLESSEDDELEEESDEEDNFSLHQNDPYKGVLLEGPVYAMCMTSNGTQERLSHWVKKLQDDNPHLARLPIIFNLFRKETAEEKKDGGLTEGTKLLETDS